MNEFSTEQLQSALKNATASGRKSDADFISAELVKRTSKSISGLSASDLAAATKVPQPEGFMEDSGINAFGRGIRENIGGGAGAAALGTAGLKAGGAAGTYFGGPVGGAIGAGVGGVGGGILGAMLGGQAQQAVFPTSEDTKRILEADQQKHPIASFAGQTVPYLATLKPSIGGIRSAMTKITPEMTAAETSAIMGHRVGTALGAGLGGASEIAMPLIQGQEIDPTRVLAGTVLGALFNEPNRLGRAIGLPSMPTLAEVRAQQMAQAAVPPQMASISPTAPDVIPRPIDPAMAARASGEGRIATGERPAFLSASAMEQAMRAREAATTSPANAALLRSQLASEAARSSTAIVPRPDVPLIDTHLVRPGEVGFPETGTFPVGNTDVRFVQPRMLTGDPAPLNLPFRAGDGVEPMRALPERAAVSTDNPMTLMRQEQAAAMQTQIDRLTQRRASMVARGANKPTIKALDVQIKARSNALKGLQNETTIIQPEPAKAPAKPIIERTRPPVDVPPQDAAPIVPRPAEVVPVEAPPPVADAPVSVTPEKVNTIPEDLARARANMAKGGAEADRVRANTEPVAAFRQQNGELKLYDGHHRLVNAIDSGAETLPVYIDGEGVKNIPLKAFDAATPTPAPNEKIPVSSSPVAKSIPEKQVPLDISTPKPDPVRAARAPAADVPSVVDTPKVADGRKGIDPSLSRELDQFDPVKGAARKDPATLAKIKSLADRVLATGDTEFADNVGYGFSDHAGTIPAKTKDPTLARLRETLLTQSDRLKKSTASDVSIADNSEAASLRKQIAKIDDDIALAHDDGDAAGAAALESARGKLQSQLDEAANPTMPKSLGDKIRAKKVKPGSKGQMSLPLTGLSDAQMRSAWNGALEVAARLADAGVKAAEYVKQAAAWVRSNFPTARFNNAEFHSALEADIVTGLPSARRAAVKDAAHLAADDMHNNLDRVLAAADGDPVKTYVQDVDKMMTDAKHDLLSRRTSAKVLQTVRDLNRKFFRGNQAALDDMAKGKAGTGRASPALEKLNGEVNGTRPGASGVSRRGIFDDSITRATARTNELSAAYNGIQKTVDTLPTIQREAFLSNLVKWMKDPNYATHLRNQPEVLKAVEGLRKITRDLYNDMKAAGIDIGDAGPEYFMRQLDADYVKRNYDDFVTGMKKVYDMQWKQNDPKYVTDMAAAEVAAKAYADAAILGHEGIVLDGSDLNLGIKRSGDPDFLKARTFTGAAGDHLDATMGKFYQRNPFETLNSQINRVERRIGLTKAFGKVDAQGVLDPTFKWREFTDAAVKEGNEALIPEALQRYQTMFGIGGNFNPTTNAFVQQVRELGYYAYLAFGGINSSVEPTTMAMRMNRPISGLFQAYGKSFRSLSRTIRDMPLDYKEIAADALGLAENATIRASQALSKFDEQGLRSSTGIAKFMFRTGNSLISNATANASVDVGMSTIRLELNEFLRGKNKAGARIWLEGVGIKRADFDSVNKWLESHASDADRFNKLMDTTIPEAGIVRDAMRTFTREARLKPDAGSKSLPFSNPFGSMLLSLQSFIYDFTDKVLARNARQFMQGVKGSVHFDGDVDPTQLSHAERAHLMAPMALGMPTLLAANYGIAMVRETLYPDPEKIRRDRERTAGEINWNRFTRSLSRTNALGPYDMLFNMFTQARYERDVAAMAVGPYMGGVLELAKNAAALSGERNSDNTNTAERKMMRSAWNITSKPLINMALSSLPATRLLTPVSALGIQAASQRSVTEGAVDLSAGNAQTTRSAPKKPKAMP